MSASTRTVYSLALLFLASLALCTGPVEAVPCVDYSLAPHVIADTDFIGSGNHVIVDGNFAYVARSGTAPDYMGGIEVVDVSNPLAPAIVESFPIFGGAVDVAISGSRLYVAAGSSGLLILNCANPLALTQVGALNPPDVPFMINDACGIALSGNIAILGEIDSGLRIIDVTNPANPVLRSTMTLGTVLDDVAASGTIAFVGSASDPLQVIDFSTPTNPVNIGSFPASGYSLAIRGNLLALDNKLLDVSTPSTPALLGTIPTSGLCYGVELQDGRALLSLGPEDGLQVFDISNPGLPLPLADVNTFGWTRASAVFGTHAIVAQDGGVAVVDLGETMVFPLASLSIPTTSVSLAFQGNYAYVGNLEPNGTQGKLHVVDISDPAAPELVNTKILRPVNGLAISGSLIVTAAGDYGAQVLTVTNPEVPVVRGTINTPGPARGVAIAGTNAFVADGSGGLQVVNVSVPEFPSIIGSLDTPGDAMAVVLEGNLAFLVDGSTSSGLRVIDISTPSSPVQIGNLNIDSWATDLALSGETVYVVQGELMRIIDVSTPSNPQLLINFDTGGPAFKISIHENLAYVTGLDDVSVIDISNPITPHLVGTISVDDPGAVEIGNGFLGVTLKTTGGLSTFPLQCGDAAVFTPVSTVGTGLRIDVRPNPFRALTSIHFSLPSPAHVSLSVFDVSGRLVRELVRGSLDGGAHSLDWDGRDEQGATTAAGVYLIRLQGGAAEDVRRIVQLR